MNKNCVACETMPDGGCKILTEMICMERRCPFFKTQKQCEMAKMKSVYRRMNMGLQMNEDDEPYIKKINERKKRDGI